MLGSSDLGVGLLHPPCSLTCHVFEVAMPLKGYKRSAAPLQRLILTLLQRVVRPEDPMVVTEGDVRIIDGMPGP